MTSLESMRRVVDSGKAGHWLVSPGTEIFSRLFGQDPSGRLREVWNSEPVFLVPVSSWMAAFLNWREYVEALVESRSF